jgi:hypothetical protein
MDDEERRLERLLDAERAKDKQEKGKQKKPEKTEKKSAKKKKSSVDVYKDPSKIMYSDWFGEEGEDR